MSIEHQGEPRGNGIREAYEHYVGPAQQTYTPTQVVIKKAKGRKLTTVDGRKLYDFAAGVLVSNLGYKHKGFKKRYKEYIQGLPRNAYNLIAPIQVEASRRLVESVGGKAEMLLWAASGSEGIQKAIWCAQHRYPDRPYILATRHGFHGKKGLAADITGASSLNPYVRWVSFPMDTPEEPEFYRNELDRLWEELPNQICLLLTEPYLGAAGSYHPPKWYHQLLQEWCNEHDIPFIFDEVQSCFGRTGNMYASQTYGVEPDLVVLGKGMASGEPAAAVVGRADLISSLEYGEASDTFSGSPMACAAVCATLDVFEEKDIVGRCRDMESKMRELLNHLCDTFPFLRQVRGEGLVYGVEVCDADTANRCVLEAYRGDGERGVHFLGPLAQKVLRVSPPLTITPEELDEAGALLEESWKRV